MELEHSGKGLNLSLQVLDGVLSHNGEIIQERYEPDKTKDFKRFLEEYQNCFKIKNYSSGLIPMTLEGCVVRISDVIAYIGRDFEDAIMLKLINRSDLPDEISKILGNTNSTIINTLITDIVVNSFDKPYLSLSGTIYCALKKLMDFNYKNIYKNPAIKDEDFKIRNMFLTLYEKYSEQLMSNNTSSEIYKDYISGFDKEHLEKNTNKGRMIIDYISGMTDTFFNEHFAEFIMPRKFGHNINSN